MRAKDGISYTLFSYKTKQSYSWVRKRFPCHRDQLKKEICEIVVNGHCNNS